MYKRLAVCWCVSLLFVMCVRAEEKADEGKALFNGKDLTGFKEKKGSWKVADGALTNEGTAADSNSRIETEDSYGNFVLTGKFLLDKQHNGEIQIHGYGQVFQIAAEKLNEWVDLKVVAKGKDVKVTVNGNAVEMEKEDAADATKTDGPIGFYIRKGGVLKLKDLKIKTD